jgi:indole-3-glycerol phosphate synthase
LIASVLDPEQLRAFRELAGGFGMAALVEVHGERDLEAALASGAEIIGVNNRDLRSFEVSLDVSVSLAAKIPANVIKVSESGIFTSSDIRRLMDQGFVAFLVGEHLVKSADPAGALKELVA